jgi:transcriptional pleiotropic regulator of transition state genes
MEEKMKKTGNFRKMDELGRVVIPSEVRKKLGIESGDSLEVYTQNNILCFKKVYTSDSYIELFKHLIEEIDTSKHDLKNIDKIKDKMGELATLVAKSRLRRP